MDELTDRLRSVIDASLAEASQLIVSAAEIIEKLQAKNAELEQALRQYIRED